MDANSQTRHALLLLAPILVVALIGGIVSFSSRGDAAFEFEQRHTGPVDARELEKLVRTAREPTPKGPGSAARTVRCQVRGNSPLRREWTCAARYPSGKTIRYQVTVRPNGSYSGIDRSGQFLVNGCCVQGAAG